MKRKGFTLVELLAVIVILAIIALITTVVVINIIETVKIRKYKVEEKSLEKAAELYYTNSQIFSFQDEISLNTLVKKGFINSVKDTGNGSTCEGKVIKDNNGELKGCLKCSNYVTEGCGYVIEQEIKDENPGVICGSGKNEDYDKQTECHIKSVEDLVAFSYLVNSGKTFEGKTVYLDKDLDITNYAKEKSYVDPDKKALYDINGDGEITSLKDEMTTDKGFQPIGTSKNKFKGKFEGNAYTISNLMINRPDEDYVGLFRYVIGSYTQYSTITGLNIENIKVKGNNYVGGLSGYINYAKINEVTLTGTIIGNEKTGTYIGGIVGSVTTSNVYIDSVIVNANVTGNSNVGGISGGPFENDAKVKAIIEGGTITGNDKVYATSYSNTSSKAVKTAYVNSKVKVIKNSEEVTGYYGGKEFSESYYNNLQYYGNLKLSSKVVVETPYSGDIDASGYYFNYNNDGTDIIVVKANNSSQSSTTGNIVYTKTVTEGDDKKAPTCTIGRYSVHGNGFTASYTCTDNTKVKARKHIYWVAEPSKVNYEDLISWPSTTDSSSETVSSVWTVESSNNIGIEPPSKGSCYYFYYGAQDDAGNTVIYATPNCISY